MPAGYPPFSVSEYSAYPLTFEESDEKLPDSLWKRDPAWAVREGRGRFRLAWNAGGHCGKDSS
ncbi:MAG: hypothetical protein V2A58_11455 [Planctomycetota bacterium]